MKVVGITGGIGSGKTLVSSVFSSMGIPVFNADEEAKMVYERHPEIINTVLTEFGDAVITDNKVNRAALANKVFNDKTALQRLNAIVHPLVAKSFINWSLKQTSNYVLREAAILIESNSYKDCAHIILVSAEEETRIERVRNRSKLSEEEIRQRMSHQMTDEQRRSFCDFEIRNNGIELILPQIAKIHSSIMDEKRS